MIAAAGDIRVDSVVVESRSAADTYQWVSLQRSNPSEQQGPVERPAKEFQSRREVEDFHAAVVAGVQHCPQHHGTRV